MNTKTKKRIDESIPIILKNYMPIFALAALIIIFSFLAEKFFTIRNLLNILQLTPILFFISIGTTLILLMGSIDLSIEGIMALSSIICSIMIKNSLTSIDIGFWNVLFGVLAGTFLGFLNGFVYVKLRIPSFMVTLGMGFAYTGIAIIIYRGYPIKILNLEFQKISSGSFLGISNLAIYSIVIFIICYIFTKWTYIGRHIFAIGENETMAGQAGIQINKIKIITFTLAGALFGLAGTLNTSRLLIGDSSSSTGFLFKAITAAVVGGTAMSGGVGGIFNALIGAFIITVLSNGMTLMGINPYLREGVNGLVLIIAVALTLDRKKIPVIK
jgi:ribose transport system permease protein